MLNIIKKSFKDFASFFMLLVNMGPVLIGVLFWGTLLFYFHDQLFEWLKHFLPQSWLSFLQGQDFFSRAGSIFINSFLYILLLFFVLLFTLIGNIFMSIFYTPIVTAYLHKKYYPTIQKESFGGISASIKILEFSSSSSSLLTISFIFCLKASSLDFSKLNPAAKLWPP